MLNIQNSNDYSLGTTNEKITKELRVCKSSPQISSDCSLKTVLLTATNTKNSHADGIVPEKCYQHSTAVHS